MMIKTPSYKMAKKKGSGIDISVIIVNYKVKKELFACIDSIINSKPKTSVEIIVVDNDDRKTILADLNSRFPQIRYIANRNRGFGQANNIGVEEANGKYLFFLNPDTKLFPGTIDSLFNFINNNKKAGIVAPLLLDPENKPYPLQGTQKLTPFNALFAYSFIDKIFPNNNVSKKFWMKGWDKTKIKEVDVVPGTALMISSDIFERVGGFDEKFFLYFEEYDICKRVKELGYKIFIEPKAKVVHFWGRSTGKTNLMIEKVFKQSRVYYFKKHFGVLSAVLVWIILGINKHTIILSSIIILGALLRLYKLQEYMPFLGDQGWFYLSARDLLVSGQIPLVGIASSHPWLHQGALWTYITGIMFYIFNFNPISPAYFSIFFDIVTIFLFYKFGRLMFSERVGSIAAYLYAFSPLVVTHSRIPYHTSLIPFFTLLLIYSIYKVTRRDLVFIPVCIFILAILYNLELATSMIWPFIGIVFILLLIQKRVNIKKILTIKIIALSLIAFLIPMLSMLIYDIGHGFPQTLKFAMWIGYRVLLIFGYPPLHPELQAGTPQYFIDFSIYQFKQLVFAESAIISFILIILSFLVVVGSSFITIMNKKNNVSYIISVGFLTSFSVYLLAKTPSLAYLPVLFPFVIFLTACFFDYFIKTKLTRAIGILILILIGFTNIRYILVSKYESYPNDGRVGYIKMMMHAKKIVDDSKGKELNLKPGGFFKTVPTGIDNYRYLVWWLGGKVSSNSNTTYTIYNGNRQGLAGRIFADGDITITKELGQ